MTPEFDVSVFAKDVIREEEEAESVDDIVVDKKPLASISPKLGILNNIPFVIPFEDRVKIFRQFVQNDLYRCGLP